MTLSVDGTVTEHTVYEQTVSDALDDLAVDVPEDAFVSEDPDAALNRTENTLVVSTTKDLVVVADGEKHELDHHGSHRRHGAPGGRGGSGQR